MDPKPIPAFPGFNYVSSNVHDGMTLRDYFAALALPSLIEKWFQHPDDVRQMDERSMLILTTAAYKLADAMLSARAS